MSWRDGLDIPKTGAEVGNSRIADGVASADRQAGSLADEALSGREEALEIVERRGGVHEGIDGVLGEAQFGGEPAHEVTARIGFPPFEIFVALKLKQRLIVEHSVRLESLR